MKPSIGRFRGHLRCNALISGVAIASIAMMQSLLAIYLTYLLLVSADPTQLG